MQLSGRMGSGRGVREGGSPSDRWLGAGAWLNGPEGDLVDGRASLIVRSPSPLRSLRSAGSAEEVSGRSTGTTLKASGTTGASAGAGGKKKTVYISLAQAARALGVTLATRSVMLGRKDGQQVLSHIEAAELRCVYGVGHIGMYGHDSRILSSCLCDCMVAEILPACWLRLPAQHILSFLPMLSTGTVSPMCCSHACGAPTPTVQPRLLLRCTTCVRHVGAQLHMRPDA
jgi:hypothetical protein